MNNQPTTLEWALYWAARGFFVFPLVSNTKIPVLPGGWKTATNDPEIIRHYWTMDPDSNIGCCPHLSGHCVIDIDTPQHGADGISTWEAICAFNGPPPVTLTHRTQSGGRHLIYRGELPSKAGTFGPGVDTRGVGGYIVMPGSTIDGRPYTIEHDCEPAPLPAWCAPERRDHEQREAPGEVDEEWAIEYARREIAQWIEQGRAPQIGSRNHTMYNRIARLYELGVPQDACAALMTEFLSHGHMPDEDIGATVERIYNQTPPQEAFGSGLPPSDKGSAIWANAEFPKPQGRRWFDWRELEAAPTLDYWDQHKMLPRYPEGSVGMVYGAGGTSKTQWLFAKSAELLRLPVGRRPRIAYLAGEGGPTGLGARLRAVRRVLGGDVPSPDWFRMAPMPRLFESEFTAFADDCEREGWIPDIIFYDTLAAGKAGTQFEEDETLAGEMTGTGMIGKLAARLKAAIVVVHHTGKDRLTLRGASGFEWNVTFLIRLIGNEAYGPTHIEVWCQRMKDGRNDFKAFYELRPDPLEGVPVPIECTETEWVWFMPERNKTKGVTAAVVRGALANVKAYGEDAGVFTVDIAAHVFGGQPKGMNDEEWGKLQNRLAARIERIAPEEFPGMHTLGTSGQMKWFLPLSERPKDEAPPTKH